MCELVWQTTKPETPGWYWIKGRREDGTEVLDVVAVRELQGQLMTYEIIQFQPLAYVKDWEWQGPIPTPKEQP